MDVAASLAVVVTPSTSALLTTVNPCWCPRGPPQGLPVQARVASPSLQHLSSDRFPLPPLELVTGRDPTVDNLQTTNRAVERCVPRHHEDVSAWLGFGLHQAIARPAQHVQVRRPKQHQSRVAVRRHSAFGDHGGVALCWARSEVLGA